MNSPLEEGLREGYAGECNHTCTFESPQGRRQRRAGGKPASREAGAWGPGKSEGALGAEKDRDGLEGCGQGRIQGCWD